MSPYVESEMLSLTTWPWRSSKSFHNELVRIFQKGDAFLRHSLVIPNTIQNILNTIEIFLYSRDTFFVKPYARLSKIRSHAFNSAIPLGDYILRGPCTSTKRHHNRPTHVIILCPSLASVLSVFCKTYLQLFTCITRSSQSHWKIHY